MTARTSHAFESILEAPLQAWRDGGIGLVGADIPIELLLATGRQFGHLPWSAGTPTPAADQWLESSFPGWARSILEQWFAGAFDALECVVFSRADDAAQRLCYYVRELQSRRLLGGPRTHLLDLALIRRPTSVMHCAAAIELLARQLHVEAGDWPAAMARAAALRSRLAMLNAQRGSHGEDYARMFRAALWSDPTRWLDAVTLPVAHSGARVLLAGSMPPDERLHRAVAAGGACVIDELHPGGPSRLGALQPQGDEPPALRLARHLQFHASGPRSMVNRAEQLVSRARDCRAHAVILWLTQEDEALAWHLPAQAQALRAAGVPLLSLPASEWEADAPVLERITGFCEGLRA